MQDVQLNADGPMHLEQYLWQIEHSPIAESKYVPVGQVGWQILAAIAKLGAQVRQWLIEEPVPVVQE